MGNGTRWALIAGALALALTACSAVVPPAGAAEPLEPFGDCDAFVSHVKEELSPYVGPWGLDGGPRSAGGSPIGVGVPEPAIVDERSVATSLDSAEVGATPNAGAPETTGGTGETPAYSGTNVQEVGIDEPDLVKTDGERIVVIDTAGTLHTIEVGENGEPVLRGAVAIGPGAHSLFLAGDRALVIGSAVPSDPTRAPMSTQLSEIDLTNLETPTIARQLAVDGDFVNARQHGDTARLVLRSVPPTLEWEQPSAPYGDESYKDAAERNRAILTEAEASDLLPSMTLTTADGTEAAAPAPAVDCANVYHPAEFAGPDLLTVVAVDLAEDLAVDHSVSVMAAGDTVYASDASLYVAFSNAWGTGPMMEGDAAAEPGTQIHAFALTSPDATEYVASGRVRGTVLNQFALSEHEGVLRVATTDALSAPPGTESFVTTLRRSDDRLEQLGQVGGLGPEEQIMSVRYVGDTAYVVTFRRTDPLYTVDLSDPAEPEVAGELKILGYSAYLHPVDADRLLGVGQDATEEGRTLGTQVSLFDVGDPAEPVRLDQLGLEQGTSSEVEWDHRAFLWWPETGTAVVPFTRWEAMPGDMPLPAVGVPLPADDRSPDLQSEPGAPQPQDPQPEPVAPEPVAPEPEPQPPVPEPEPQPEPDEPQPEPDPVVPEPVEPQPEPEPEEPVPPIPEPIDPQPLPEPPAQVDATSGALVLNVDESGLTQAGIVTGDPSLGNVLRSLVIGDTLYTVWNGGITASSLDDLAVVGQAAWSRDAPGVDGSAGQFNGNGGGNGGGFGWRPPAWEFSD